MSDVRLAEILTFDDARRLVASQLAPSWPANLGTFYVSPKGWANSTHYRVDIGPREWMVDGDIDFRPWDSPVVLVEKATGHVKRLPWIDAPTGMVPISASG
jgi:hypothetical protein